ncbi:MAG: ArsR/SmtB family transcription factor [Bacillota bacterium]
MVSVEQVSLALSDPIRLKVLDLLAAGRDQACCSPDNPAVPAGVCACDVLGHLDMSPSKLSYHLKELSDAGLISEAKRGRWIYYTINREALSEFLSVVRERFVEERPPDCTTCGDG